MLQVFGRRVASAHPRQHRVGAALHRQVDVGAELRLAAMGLDQGRVEEQRMRARVADPLDAVGLGQAAQQRRERQRPGLGAAPAPRIVAAVRVHRLPEERDLADAAPGEALDLSHDVVRPPAHLPAPGVRHDAEAAEHVAALHHRDEGPARALTDELGMPLGQIEAREGAVLVRPRLPQAARRGFGHGRDEAQVVGAEHEVDLGEARQQGVSLLLRDAAADAHDAAGAGLLPGAQQAEVGVETVLGLLPDRARVHQQQVGRVLAARRAEAVMVQEIRDLLGIMGVHLAAVGPDPEPAAARAAGRVRAGAHALPPGRDRNPMVWIRNMAAGPAPQQISFDNGTRREIMPEVRFIGHSSYHPTRFLRVMEWRWM